MTLPPTGPGVARTHQVPLSRPRDEYRREPGAAR